MINFILHILVIIISFKLGEKIGETFDEITFERRRKVGKLTEGEIEKIIANANATLGFENMRPSNEANEITREYLRGNLTKDEALSKIIMNHFSKSRR